RAGGRGRDDRGAGPRDGGGHRGARRSHRSLHPRPVSLPGGRRARHQLPPTAVDAAVAGRVLLRAGVERSLHRGAGPGVPLPLVRRRHGRRPGRRGRLTVDAARFEPTAVDGAARTGVVRTARGSYAVPAFMPVGTRGVVKALDSRDLEAVGAEVVLANTYHL